MNLNRLVCSVGCTGGAGLGGGGKVGFGGGGRVGFVSGAGAEVGGREGGVVEVVQPARKTMTNRIPMIFDGESGRFILSSFGDHF